MAKQKRIYVPVSDNTEAEIKKIAKNSYRSKAGTAAWLLENAVEQTKK